MPRHLRSDIEVTVRVQRLCAEVEMVLKVRVESGMVENEGSKRAQQA